MRYTLLICFLLFTSVLQLSAQVPPRAQKSYYSALQYQVKHRPDKAEAAMYRAIKEYPGYAEAYGTLGKWLFDTHRFRAAAELYLQAERSCTNGSTVFALPTATALLYNGDYAGALSRIPASSGNSNWKKLAVQARFMQGAMKVTDTAVVLPVGILQRINTRNAETFPFLSADGATFYFTRRVNDVDDDIYYAKRDSCGGWLGAKNMGMPPNSPAAESAPTISADRHYLFMTRCDNRSENGWDQGGCDLFMAYTAADSVWSIPLSFGATINTPSFEGMATLSSDNRELFFVSNRPGGYGGMDIWSSRFEHGLWQLPHNLGPTINTTADETAPFIYADNETLYFTSNGHPGMGGKDLYQVKKTGDTTWGAPVNLGWPINTPYDEVSLSLDATGDTAYFASDRDSLTGNFDLYQVALPQTAKPGAIGYYSGYIYDSLEYTPLNYANIYFTDSVTGKEAYHVVSNRGDGSYMIALPAGHSYSLMLSRIGYLQMMDTLRCSVTDVQHPNSRNFALLPVGYEKPVTDSLVLTICFKKNSTSLTDSDKALLTRTLEPWTTVKDARLLINGYTDNTGTPLLNEQLSYARARIVSELVKVAGFHEELIQPQGWGEANPLAANDTEENRDKNRRVEIVIRR